MCLSPFFMYFFLSNLYLFLLHQIHVLSIYLLFYEPQNQDLSAFSQLCWAGFQTSRISNHPFLFRLRVERANDESTEDTSSNNGNNAGRNLKVEALTTVRQLERFLAKSVARQWYDMERTTFNFVQKIKAEAPITFTYEVRDCHLFFLSRFLLTSEINLISLFFSARFRREWYSLLHWQQCRYLRMGKSRCSRVGQHMVVWRETVTVRSGWGCTLEITGTTERTHQRR